MLRAGFSRGLPQMFSLVQRSWFGAVKKFHLPDLGEKIKEGTIKKWYVKEGDVVEEFQKIADVASDKQFTELTAFDSGRITKLHFKEEDVCQVGQLLLELETSDGQPAVAQTANTPATKQQQPKTTSNQPAPQVSETKQQRGNEIQATPAVRHMVKEHKLDIKHIIGTGKGGRILKEDVLKYIDNLSKPKPAASTVKSTQTPATKTHNTSSKTGGKRVVEMKPFERGMQKTMTESNTIPHLYFHEQVDLTELFELRDSLKKSTKIPLTFMSFFVKFFSSALRDFPILNSTYDVSKPFEYTIHDHHNITIAIDSPNGLAVPNIKNVGSLSIIEVQREINRLRKDAEEAKLHRADLEGGTISLSNIGTVGGNFAGPLILPPQIAIVALGKTVTLPRYINNNFTSPVPRKIMAISFSCDHRVVDGGTVAKFANRWKNLMETPALLLSELK